MNVTQYIESGMLEAYCLGCLTDAEQAQVLQICNTYPELRDERDAIEKSMESFAAVLAVAPKVNLKNQILNTLFASKVNVDNLPETSSASVLDAWLNGLAGIIPAEHNDPFFYQLLRHDEQIMQALVISKVNIPEETHEEVIESFFILEGRCRCIIDSAEYILGPGDFIEIPLHTNHDVELLSPHVMAIHQQKALPGKVLA